MDGDETENITVFHSDHQFSIWVTIELHDLLSDEALGPRISQLSKQISYFIGVCHRCPSDLHIVLSLLDRTVRLRLAACPQRQQTLGFSGFLDEGVKEYISSSSFGLPRTTDKRSDRCPSCAELRMYQVPG